MRHQARRIAAVLVAAAALAAGLLIFHRHGRRAEPDPKTLASLRQQHEQLHTRLDELLARDTETQSLVDKRAQVLVAMRASYARDLIQEIAARYLDRVTLELEAIEVHERGEVQPRTFLGKVKAGVWWVELDIHHVKGVLRGGRPRVRYAGTNRLGVRLPVRLEGGQGRATLRFTWDAKGIAGLVCRDFDVTREIAGRVLSRDYELSGAFKLAAEREYLTARPEFPDTRFRLFVDLQPESWDALRGELAQQDTPGRCGLALDPDKVVERLRELVQRGFDVKLPDKLQRTVRLPAAFEPSVEIEGRTVALSIKPLALKVTQEMISYGAAVVAHGAPPQPTRLGDAGLRHPGLGRSGATAATADTAARLTRLNFKLGGAQAAPPRPPASAAPVPPAGVLGWAKRVFSE